MTQKEHDNKRNAEYYKANKEQILIRQKKYKQENLEKVKEQKSAWMKTKRNKANVIKKTYLLILPSNVAIYRR